MEKQKRESDKLKLHYSQTSFSKHNQMSMFQIDLKLHYSQTSKTKIHLLRRVTYSYDK